LGSLSGFAERLTPLGPQGSIAVRYCQAELHISHLLSSVVV
jgi:hypothetical protein